MALIAIAVWDTEENQRTDFTSRTIDSLHQTVDWSKHRLIVIDNGSCEKTKELLDEQLYPEELITLNSNIGTAAAINLAWKTRKPNEHCIKMDNDVVVYQEDWIDQMVAAIERDPNIGQVGLKRKDLWEQPSRTDFYKSELYMLPHENGQPWIVGEKVNHVMGTCVMHSSRLLDKLGYLYQPRLYGFDDSLMSARSKLAGFINIFLPYIEIDHIDPGGTPYQKWKENHASEQWKEYHEVLSGYQSGQRSLYYNPFQ
jgi:GT2 family glycosyltransferase